MRQLHDLFDAQQLKTIETAPQFLGTRHPTWFPLFAERQRAIDVLVHEGVARISAVGNEKWLRDLTPNLLDQKDVNNASSSLAEIRAYGGLLEAGFSVSPIPRKNAATPDFDIDAGDGPVTTEVFSKHQDKEEDTLLDAIHSPVAALPLGVERRTLVTPGRTVTSTVAVLTPGGKPDLNKPHDSVQANLISRVCAMKKDEHQIPEDRPALLIADFAHFGDPVGAEFLKSGQAAPLESGHQGITCGSIWYGMYGWKGAPIFEEGSHRLVSMGHDGRFRISGPKKSKLSAVLVVFSDSAVLLENPWAAKPLPEQARLALCRHPWFDLSRSVANWRPGDAEQQVALHRHMIETMDQTFFGMRVP